MKRSRHGLYALKAVVKVRGLGAIDRRTVAGQALIRWRRELIADLGGEASVSAQQEALVDVVVRTRLFVDALDVWLLEQASLVVGRRRSVVPVLRERQALVDFLARVLGQLGLERRAKPAPTLGQVLAARAAGGGDGEAPPGLEEAT